MNKELIKLARTIYPEKCTDDYILNSKEYRNALASISGQEELTEEIKEQGPVLVGKLNRRYGYNHYKPIEVGTPVYALNDKYFFEMELIKTGEIQRQSFYKESLRKDIDFLEDIEGNNK